MAGHEWDDWFEREELIGQISDIRVQNLQGKSAGGMGWVEEYDHEHWYRSNWSWSSLSIHLWL